MTEDTDRDPLDELREADRWKTKKFYDRIADAWQAEREANKRSETFGVMSIEHLQSKLDATRKENDACEAAQTSNVEEIAALQAKLDASLPLPLDADGVPCRIGDKMTGRDGYGGSAKFVVDAIGDDRLYYHALKVEWTRASSCHHVKPKPETIEDVCAEAPQDQVSLDLVNRAYECGKRDGRKLDADECRACAAAVMDGDAS